ncbi:acyl-ACP desaturase [Streptomyces sp. ISL-98]|uniref:acyl-ACP desaturase n=1 Tax=Streptomyces sp. ISL-98 TaxID=2819192 RepID=UPI001BE54AC3|nr:acyl-ACP desaturase [Streptomyces sp. ISL-98]MBT2511744.1 acyl-ACP desaturase [Streptomyces sp. ISL-98]
MELEPVVARLVDRHLGTVREWFPHQYIPWSRGADFEGPLGGTGWHTGQSKLSTAARSSWVLNLLTEDNLPSYHYAFATTVSRAAAWTSPSRSHQLQSPVMPLPLGLRTQHW